MSKPTLPLPGGYWWSDTADGSVLYLCYGWAASVTATETEVRGRGGSHLRGRCGSIAQGKRFVERWVLGSSTGTYRRWKAARTPPRPYVPTDADRGYLAILNCAGAPADPVDLAPEPGGDGWENWAWRVDVPFDALLGALKR